MTSKAMAGLLRTCMIVSSVLVFAGDARSDPARIRHHPGSSAADSLGTETNSESAEPFFQAEENDRVATSPDGVANVTAQLGITTYLHCRVNSLGGKTVSWLKRHGDTPHLLTYGLTTYNNDARFQIFHSKPNDWRLQIQFPQPSDAGIYECLVSTEPPIRKRFRLTVVAPEIKIVDERDKSVSEKFYKGGSTIELKCVVSQIVGQAPEYIIWHHEDRMLNYDTERGGISVRTDLLKDGAVSRLFIARAVKADSGNYTCGMRNAQASVVVHILNGENPAAMQTGTSPHVQSQAHHLLVIVCLAFAKLAQCRMMPR